MNVNVLLIMADEFHVDVQGRLAEKDDFEVRNCNIRDQIAKDIEKLTPSICTV